MEQMLDGAFWVLVGVAMLLVCVRGYRRGLRSMDTDKPVWEREHAASDVTWMLMMVLVLLGSVVFILHGLAVLGWL